VASTAMGQSGCGNPQSPIINPQSANRQSAICNRQ
jgi:hypothetical protein